MALFFPKDHYLPFLRSKTIFSHLFFVFGVIGKSFFLMAAIHGFVFLRQRRYGREHLTPGLKPAMQAVVWGFGFWTFSMFAAEIWSYLGWGSPVGLG